MLTCDGFPFAIFSLQTDNQTLAIQTKEKGPTDRGLCSITSAFKCIHGMAGSKEALGNNF